MTGPISDSWPALARANGKTLSRLMFPPSHPPRGIAPVGARGGQHRNLAVARPGRRPARTRTDPPGPLAGPASPAGRVIPTVDRGRRKEENATDFGSNATDFAPNTDLTRISPCYIWKQADSKAKKGKQTLVPKNDHRYTGRDCFGERSQRSITTTCASYEAANLVWIGLKSRLVPASRGLRWQSLSVIMTSLRRV
jgi:hypothetical protein